MPGIWHSGGVDTTKTEWLSVPDVAENLETTPGKVRRLVEEHALLGRKIDGIFVIPAALLERGEPLTGVAGTATVLLDGGWGLDETLDWLLAHHDELGVTPIEALRGGRKTEVRRIAQLLAL